MGLLAPLWSPETELDSESLRSRDICSGKGVGGGSGLGEDPVEKDESGVQVSPGVLYRLYGPFRLWDRDIGLSNLPVTS